MTFEEFLRSIGLNISKMTADELAEQQAIFERCDHRNSYLAENSGARAFSVTPKTFNADERTVEAILTTDEPCLMYDWDRGWIPEVLPMETGTFPERMPLLDSHNTHGGIKNLLGSCLNLKTKAGKRSSLLSDLVISEDADGEAALRKIEGGHLTDLSIGYMVTKSKYLADGEVYTLKANGKTYTGPMKIALKWSPHEASLCPIGADKFAKIRSARSPQQTETIGVDNAENSQRQAENKSQEANAMTFTQFCRSIGIDESKLTEAQTIGIRALFDANCKDLEADAEISTSVKSDARKLIASGQEAVERGIKLENARQAEIRSMCADHQIDNAKVDEMIKDNSVTVEQARALVLESLKSQRTPVSTPQQAITGGDTDIEKMVRAATHGMAMRHGIQVEAPAAGANEFRGRSVLRIAEECLNKRGINTRSMTNDEIAQRAMNTGDFPIILSNVANLSLTAAYMNTEETWRDIAEINNDVSDFKNLTVASVGGIPTFSKVLEDGSYKSVNFDEIGESYKVNTYGCEMKATRQMIVNDSMGAFFCSLENFSQGADRLIGNGVYGILTTNGTTETLGNGTSNNLFSAAHGNLIASADALGIDAMAALRLAFRKMKGILGAEEGATQDSMNIRLDRLIVPSELEEAAMQLVMNPSFIVDGVGVKNNSFGTKLTVEDRLSTDSLVNYYGAAMRKSIQVAFLNGRQSPEIVQLNSRNPDLFEVMARIDVGWAPIDHRFLVKAAVE